MRKIKVGDVVTFDRLKVKTLFRKDVYEFLGGVGFKGTVDAVFMAGIGFTISGCTHTLPNWCLIEGKIDYDNLMEIEE